MNYNGKISLLNEKETEFIARLNNKRVFPQIKGQIKHSFDNEFNTLCQMLHDYTLLYKIANGVPEDFNIVLTKDMLRDICSLFAAWGAYNLELGMSEEEKMKMDIKTPKD